MEKGIGEGISQPRLWNCVWRPATQSRGGHLLLGGNEEQVKLWSASSMTEDASAAIIICLSMQKGKVLLVSSLNTTRKSSV